MTITETNTMDTNITNHEQLVARLQRVRRWRRLRHSDGQPIGQIRSS